MTCSNRILVRVEPVSFVLSLSNRVHFLHVHIWPRALVYRLHYTAFVLHVTRAEC